MACSAVRRPPVDYARRVGPDLIGAIVGKYAKLLSLLVAIVSGLLVPQAASLVFLIQYLVIGMLFCAFLEIAPNLRTFDKSLLAVLGANLAIPVVVYVLVRPFDPQLALVGFVTAISPTATAAPVIAGFCGSKIDYVAASVLITNTAVVLILPFVLSFQNGLDAGAIWSYFTKVVVVVFGPFVLAQVLRRYGSDVAKIIKCNNWLPFGAWLIVLFLATSSASQFIRASAGSAPLHIVPLALLSLAICVMNFTVGYLVGLPKYGREASQSLGQKNTMLMVWFSLSFCSPVTALGPTFYVIYHNLYNCYQMLRRSWALSALPRAEDVQSDI